jgi:hypothetical protein
LLHSVRFFFHCLRDLGFEQVGEGVAQGEKNILLAGEIKIERAFRCAGFADDVIHFGVVVAFGGEDFYSRLQNSGTGFLRGVGVWCGHGDYRPTGQSSQRAQEYHNKKSASSSARIED